MTFKDGYKQLTELHIKNHAAALESILDYVETDGEVFKSVKEFLLKRAEIEEDYATRLEKLVKSFKIKGSKGGVLKPNNPISSKAVKSSLLGSTQGMNEALALGDGYDAYRPVDMATNFLLQEAEGQAKARFLLAARLSQRISSMVSDWEKCFKYRVRQANEYGYVIKKSFNELQTRLTTVRKDYMKKHEFMLKSAATFKSLEKNSTPESSPIYQKAKAAAVSSEKEFLESKNEYILAVKGINTHIRAFRESLVPSFFECCNGLFVSDLKKMMIEFDVVATHCYEEGLAAIQNFDDTLSKMNVVNEYEWFEKVKGVIPSAHLIYNYEPVDDWMDPIIDNGEIVREASTVKLQDLIKQRDRCASNAEKLEADILATEQLVEIYSQHPDKGQFLEPLIQSVDYKFRLMILRNHLALLDTEIQALVDAGVIPSEAGVSIVRDVFRIVGTYVAAHHYDVTVHPGDKIRVVDDVLHNGWVHIKTILGKEGYIPSVLIDGIGQDAVLKVEAISDYTSTCPGELTFKKGDEVRVLDIDIGSSNWWQGECNGEVGVFPRSYVEPLAPPIANYERKQSTVSRNASTNGPSSVEALQSNLKNALSLSSSNPIIEIPH